MMIRVAVLALAVAGTAAAQPAVVEVRGDPGAVLVDGVLADASTAGDARRLSVEAGARTVALVEDPTAWNSRTASVELDLAAGDTVAVELRLPVRTRVETLPLGAALELVRADGSREALGTSPAVVDLPPGTSARVVATLDGHHDAEAELPARSAVSLLLPPVGAPDADAVTLLPMRTGTRTRTLVDVGIGAATLAAGAFAVAYKRRADRLDDQLRASAALRSDETLRQEIERYDRISTVGLVGMQAGLGVLAVRFILR